MTPPLTGKTAIVTGAASGVGLATARRFAEAGARVVMAGTDEAQLKAEAEQLTEDGAEVQVFSADLREKLAVANLIASATDAFDRIDILVNASRTVMSADPLDAETDIFEPLMQQNVIAPLRLSQAVARKMIKQCPDAKDGECIGSIVNITSIAAERTLPSLMSYSVACAAVDQLTRALAVSLAGHGIRVNAVALGSVLSTSLKDALSTHEDLHDQVRDVTPLGRIGEPVEAAEAALFLASPQASFVTGQILAVDGGRTLLDPLDGPAY
ncbi:SDR family NAD(P)-dependent oxidoreductase [Oceanomicrobium pacificus]|uniref:SDR family oxidoreductase n=1 Tax=Oceanomicrobium pacificus TaxID=2692916 RepID=A0A6B0TVU6_9RHOB|nr:SDR family oxidoreductase [Oceanomicrobium pacificus]MXU66819.1 SDR family oxidoreductase [Oceanomicrobium pacificus]